MTRRRLLAATLIASVGAIGLLVMPLPQTPRVAATEPPPKSQSTAQASDAVLVVDPLMVVNVDGSASLSATLHNTQDVEVALTAVQVQSEGSELGVASTAMWLPVLPSIPARAGDASDAGGFVVPRGVVAGRNVQVRFVFDDHSCLTVQVEATRRTSQHGGVFPTNGRQLGSTRTATGSSPSDCSTPSLAETRLLAFA